MLSCNFTGEISYRLCAVSLNSTEYISNLFSIKQKDTESVIVVVVIAEETPSGQVDGHLVTSLQVDGHYDGRAVLLVAPVFVRGPGHLLAVNPQTSAGSQCHPRSPGVTVDGEGEAVDTRLGSSEDASL